MKIAATEREETKDSLGSSLVERYRSAHHLCPQLSTKVIIVRESPVSC